VFLLCFLLLLFLISLSLPPSLPPSLPQAPSICKFPSSCFNYHGLSPGQQRCPLTHDDHPQYLPLSLTRCCQRGNCQYFRSDGLREEGGKEGRVGEGGRVLARVARGCAYNHDGETRVNTVRKGFHVWTWGEENEELRRDGLV